jgi:hypothetical protein
MAEADASATNTAIQELEMAKATLTDLLDIAARVLELVGRVEPGGATLTEANDLRGQFCERLATLRRTVHTHVAQCPRPSLVNVRIDAAMWIGELAHRRLQLGREAVAAMSQNGDH